MPLIMVDRRNRRSPKPLEALTLFLEAERKRLGVRALTVSTAQGQLLAGSGIGLRRVASVGARVDHDGEGSGLLSQSVATWRLSIGDEQLVVTSLGRKMTANLGEGVRRILTEV
jgi:hypothetical protein